MRGLPACGKSHAAKQLVAHGGVVLETDEYFYTQVGTDATQYDWSDDLLPAARAWNLARFRAALGQGVSPIVVDRGNGRNAETREYVELARQHGYDVQLKEPDSPWWLEIRELLRNRSVNRPQLDEWAVRRGSVPNLAAIAPGQRDCAAYGVVSGPFSPSRPSIRASRPRRISSPVVSRAS